MEKVKMLGGLMATGVLLLLNFTIPSWGSDCNILSDDFSIVNSFSSQYSARNGHWDVQGGTLNVSHVTSGKSAMAIRSFEPSGPFSADIDVDMKGAGDDNYVGLYVYTDGDVLFGISGVTVDGIEVLVYPNSGHVYFYFWSPVDQKWHRDGPYTFSGNIHSFGLTVTEEKVIFRANGMDTSLELPVSFENFYLVMDKLWIEAGGDGVDVSFDNLCIKTYPTGGGGSSSPQPHGGLALPDSKNTYIVSAASSPTTTGSKDQINPLGLGSAATGGSTLDVRVALPQYQGPVDVFVALSTSLVPGEIFLFDGTNQIVSLSRGLAKWKSNLSQAIDETLLGGIPVSLFPNADFTFYVLVTPAGATLDAYDLWVSHLRIGSGQPTTPVGGGSTESPGSSGLRGDVTSVVDQAMGLAPSIMSLVKQFSGILNDSGSSGIVTTTPSEIDLLNLPSNITVDIDFGAGYTLADGSVMAGSVELALSNIQFNQDGIGADFVLTAERLLRDGQEILDGTCSGSLKMTMNSSGKGDLTGNIALAGLKVNGESIEGSVLISGKNIDINEETFDEIVVTPQDLTYGDFTISSGTITLKQATSSRLEIDSDLQTSKGPFVIALVVAPHGAKGYELNTSSQGNVMGYGIQVNGLIYDASVCENYPIGGSIVVTRDGQSGRVSFTDACDGSYDYSEL